MNGAICVCIDNLFTDGEEGTAVLLTHCGYRVPPERCRGKGPMPQPCWMSLPQLIYAQVIKTTRQRCLVRITHRLVFGTLEAIERVLAVHDWQINTAFIERANLGRVPCKRRDRWMS